MIVLKLNEYDLLTLKIMLTNRISLYGKNGKSFYNDLNIYNKNTKRYKTSKSLFEHQIKDIKQLIRIHNEINNTLNFIRGF